MKENGEGGGRGGLVCPPVPFSLHLYDEVESESGGKKGGGR